MTSSKKPEKPGPLPGEEPIFEEWWEDLGKPLEEQRWPNVIMDPGEDDLKRMYWGESFIPRFVADVKAPGGRNVSLDADAIAEVAYMLVCYISMLPWRVMDGESLIAPPGQRIYGVNATLEVEGQPYFKTAQELVSATGPRGVHPALTVWVHRGWPRAPKPTALPAGGPAEEFRVLSQRVRPWLWGGDAELAEAFDGHETRFVKEYRMEPGQLLADAIIEYLKHPQQARETAPRFVQWLCALVDDEQEIRRIIAFVESGGLKPADDTGTSIKIEGEGKQK